MAIDYDKHKASPVIVDGVFFRSRLEATWSIFFNYMGWKWEYEPAIASAIFQGWLPDFALYTSHDPAPFYCEVKPLAFGGDTHLRPSTELTADPQPNDVDEVIAKVTNSCLELNRVKVLILGDSLFYGRTKKDYGLGIGWTSTIKNGVWQQWQKLMIEHVCDRGYLEFDSELLNKTFEGKWDAARKKAMEAYNWISGSDSMTFWLLDTAADVHEKQQIVIDYNRSFKQ